MTDTSLALGGTPNPKSVGAHDTIAVETFGAVVDFAGFANIAEGNILSVVRVCRTQGIVMEALLVVVCATVDNQLAGVILRH